jgi:acetyl-CoA acyltransferase
MGHYPLDKDFNPSPRVFYKDHRAAMMMGITAEYLARKYRVPREAQDAFAFRSQQLARTAFEQGRFKEEVLPTWGLNEQSQRELLSMDQTIRGDTTLEGLAALPPAFDPKSGTITAGNSSPLSVGASALLMMSQERARELGLTPRAKIRAMGVAGVEPCEMGIGPVKATANALQRAGLSIDEIDAIELNEAFAAQSLAVMKVASFAEEKVNTWGGAIALGHALGSSGARLVVTLIHRLMAGEGRLGLATLCVGGGQGETTIIEAC